MFSGRVTSRSQAAAAADENTTRIRLRTHQPTTDHNHNDPAVNDTNSSGESGTESEDDRMKEKMLRLQLNRAARVLQSAWRRRRHSELNRAAQVLQSAWRLHRHIRQFGRAQFRHFGRQHGRNSLKKATAAAPIELPAAERDDEEKEPEEVHTEAPRSVEWTADAIHEGADQRHRCSVVEIPPQDGDGFDFQIRCGWVLDGISFDDVCVGSIPGKNVAFDRRIKALLCIKGALYGPRRREETLSRNKSINKDMELFFIANARFKVRHADGSVEWLGPYGTNPRDYGNQEGANLHTNFSYGDENNDDFPGLVRLGFQLCHDVVSCLFPPHTEFIKISGGGPHAVGATIPGGGPRPANRPMATPPRPRRSPPQRRRPSPPPITSPVRASVLTSVTTADHGVARIQQLPAAATPTELPAAISERTSTEVYVESATLHKDAARELTLDERRTRMKVVQEQTREYQVIFREKMSDEKNISFEIDNVLDRGQPRSIEERNYEEAKRLAISMDPRAGLAASRPGYVNRSLAHAVSPGTPFLSPVSTPPRLRASSPFASQAPPPTRSPQIVPSRAQRAVRTTTQQTLVARRRKPEPRIVVQVVKCPVSGNPVLVHEGETVDEAVSKYIDAGCKETNLDGVPDAVLSKYMDSLTPPPKASTPPQSSLPPQLPMSVGPSSLPWNLSPVGGEAEHQNDPLVQDALKYGGWTIAVDKKKNKAYYSNTNLRKTTWDLKKDIEDGRYPKYTAAGEENESESEEEDDAVEIILRAGEGPEGLSAEIPSGGRVKVELSRSQSLTSQSALIAEAICQPDAIFDPDSGYFLRPFVRGEKQPRQEFVDALRPVSETVKMTNIFFVYRRQPVSEDQPPTSPASSQQTTAVQPEATNRVRVQEQKFTLHEVVNGLAAAKQSVNTDRSPDPDTLRRNAFRERYAAVDTQKEDADRRNRFQERSAAAALATSSSPPTTLAPNQFRRTDIDDNDKTIRSPLMRDYSSAHSPVSPSPSYQANRPTVIPGRRRANKHRKPPSNNPYATYDGIIPPYTPHCRECESEVHEDRMNFGTAENLTESIAQKLKEEGDIYTIHTRPGYWREEVVFPAATPYNLGRIIRLHHTADAENTMYVVSSSEKIDRNRHKHLFRDGKMEFQSDGHTWVRLLPGLVNSRVATTSYNTTHYPPIPAPTTWGDAKKQVEDGVTGDELYKAIEATWADGSDIYPLSFRDGYWQKEFRLPEAKVENFGKFIYIDHESSWATKYIHPGEAFHNNLRETFFQSNGFRWFRMMMPPTEQAMLRHKEDNTVPSAGAKEEGDNMEETDDVKHSSSSEMQPDPAPAQNTDEESQPQAASANRTVKQRKAEAYARLEAAQEAVGNITFRQLSEIKSFKSPPAPIKAIFGTILVLMSMNEEEIAKGKATTPPNWQFVQKKFASVIIIPKIIEFSPENVPFKILQSIVERMESNEERDDFSVERAQKVSTGAVPMAMWLRAVVECAQVLMEEEGDESETEDENINIEEKESSSSQNNTEDDASTTLNDDESDERKKTLPSAPAGDSTAEDTAAADNDSSSHDVAAKPTTASDRYFLMRQHKLGSGGFGSVYKGFDRHSGLYVAIKETVSAPFAVSSSKQVSRNENDEDDMQTRDDGSKTLMSITAAAGGRTSGLLDQNNMTLDSQEADDKVLQALKGEFELLTSLQHPNIVNVFAFEMSQSLIGGTQQQQHTRRKTPPQLEHNQNQQQNTALITGRIVMEWMSGGSLSEMIKASQFRLHESIVRRYTRDILKGLAFLHERGILHRDIKPANVLLSPDGSAKVSDFGTSRQVLQNLIQTKKSNPAPAGGGGATDHHDDGDDDDSQQSSAHESANTLNVVGTPCYLSKEAICGGKYSRASDLWAVGCSVVEMASGRLPWYHLGVRDAIPLMFAIGTTQEPNHHPLIPAQLSTPLKEILVRCFHPQPGERPSAQGLLDDPYFDESNDALFFASMSMFSMSSGKTGLELNDLESMGDYQMQAVARMEKAAAAAAAADMGKKSGSGRSGGGRKQPAVKQQQENTVGDETTADSNGEGSDGDNGEEDDEDGMGSYSQSNQTASMTFSSMNMAPSIMNTMNTNTSDEDGVTRTFFVGNDELCGFGGGTLGGGDEMCQDQDFASQ